MNDIERIVSDLEQQREAIDRALAALREITQPVSTVKDEQPLGAAARPQKRHRMSAAGRRAISEATKRRWALKRAAESAATLKKPTATRSRKARKKTARKKHVTKQAAATQTV